MLICTRDTYTIRKKSRRGNKIFRLVALVILLLVFLGMAVESNAQVGPRGVNSGGVTWVDLRPVLSSIKYANTPF